MTDDTSHIIPQALERFLDNIDQLTAGDTTELDLVRLDQLARTFSVYLKAAHDFDAHSRLVAEATTQQKYTRYEDLPPPSAADRARLIARLRALYDKVNAGEEIPDLLE